ncbi:MAG: SDR family NAD(P)-dependent oxidoreductase [Aeromicrobium sp.]|uniref:SDR family NAD(P)-dependent oxidoreductase n=1 Tax=Aeromicrobium sp. TaxID=1871063 RepID=UPI0026343202|nr:SDR family oxidoreductase [Aeromicrobium sp.]MDF1704901.1 SDR family NAD(P)-dependent oxidoreductase [Aeromicrobium sp.]
MTDRGRIAVVTGAMSGIGRAVSDRFAADGWQVYRVGRGATGADEIELDVRSPEDWSSLADRVRTDHGRLDVLVNNAGILREAPLEDTTLPMWEEVISVNLTGTFLGCRALVPLLRQGREPAICNLSSIDALSGSRDHTAYAASKGGIAAMTRSLAFELAPAGIRVNAICPGTVETPMTSDLLVADAAAGQPREDKHPLGRISTPAEQAAAAAFLCGTDASFVTGVCLSVDGGRAIR